MHLRILVKPQGARRSHTTIDMHVPVSYLQEPYFDLNRTAREQAQKYGNCEVRIELVIGPKENRGK